MNDRQRPEGPWREQPPVPSAVIARQRGRARIRAVTIAAGAAGLAAAGVVAFTLPAPHHSGQVSSTRRSSPSPAGRISSGPAVNADDSGGESGDDGSAASGSRQSSQGSFAPTAGSGSSHATSGGS